MNKNHKWDKRMLDLAAHVATWSKDPSTQTGAVIVRPDRTVASMGYNGLPRQVKDHADRLNDRTTKYAMTVHAEPNAIIAAKEPLTGYTIYVHPWPPCGPCAASIIQAGIRRVVTVEPTAEQYERWGDSMDLAFAMFGEANVVVGYLDNGGTL